MEIEIKIDAACREPRVVIFTDKVTDEVTALMKKLSGSGTPLLTGYKDEALEILEEREVFRIYAEGGRVIAATERGEYTLCRRLYELEESLDKGCFVRISNSEIINLKKVRKFDLSLTGTICVSMTDGAVTYVSRRYVSKIKRVLGI